MYEILRNGSRSCGFVRCTSTAGSPTALSASSMAMLVCVYAAGFIIIASKLPCAACMASIIDPSWFDCIHSVVTPASLLTVCMNLSSAA